MKAQQDMSDHKHIAIEKLPKGEFLRLRIDGPVWIRGDYDRAARKYEIYKFDDVNHLSARKKGTIVFFDFNF